MHVRTVHGVTLYDPDKSQPESSLDRLVVLVWKSNEKAGRKAHSTRCFSVPRFWPNLTGDGAKFSELLIDKMEELQNKAAHKYVTAELDNGVINPQIPAELLEPDTIFANWQIEQESGRGKGKLSKEDIAAWFKIELEETLQLAIAEKKGWLAEDYQVSDKEQKQLAQFAASYCELVSRLSAPKPDLKKEYLEQVEKTLDLLPEEKKDSDPIYRKLVAKIEKMQGKQEDDFAAIL